MQTQQKGESNHETYRLVMEGPLKITMPPKPKVSEEELEAQLFSYIANAPKDSQLTTIADLDDEWAEGMYPGIGGIEGLRNTIQAQIAAEQEYAYEAMKTALIEDALIARLEGDIPTALIEANKAEVRYKKEAAIHEGGKSLSQYLREENISEEDFDRKLDEETHHMVALTIALDTFSSDTQIEINENELSEYLYTDDPQGFLAELKEKNLVNEACRAAARVAALRKLRDEAQIELA